LNKDDTRFRVLHVLAQTPDATQRKIALRLGLSASAVNYVLKALVKKGQVKVENFRTSRNKFGYVYLLTPTGVAEKMSLTGAFIRRKLAERERIDAEIGEVLATRDAQTRWVGTDTNTALQGKAQTPTVARTRTFDDLSGGVKRSKACPDIGV
jgi:EPS-associated MarR family transcriptional regulator